MTAKEYCIAHPTIAYYSGLNGVEIHGVEYGIDDYIFCESGAWGSKKIRKYHRLKVHYGANGDAFFMLRGYRIPLSECIRTAI